MKYFYIPCAILALILSLSLLNAGAVSDCVTAWCGELNAAQTAADGGNWAEAEHRIASVHDAWDKKQAYFHIVSVHAELDEAEALLAKSLSFAREQDAAEFRANIAELITRLRLLSEIQEVSVKNIL